MTSSRGIFGLGLAFALGIMCALVGVECTRWIRMRHETPPASKTTSRAPTNTSPAAGCRAPSDGSNRLAVATAESAGHGESPEEALLANRLTAYQSSLTACGVGAETQDKITARLATILREKAQVAALIRQLRRDQSDADGLLREALGPKYAEFEAVDMHDKSTLQVQQIVAFCTQNGLSPIDGAHADLVGSALQKYRAFSPNITNNVDSQGALEPLPSQPVGSLAVNYMEESTNQLKANAASAIAELADAGVDANTINALEQYFATEIAMATRMTENRKVLAAHIQKVQSDLAGAAADGGIRDPAQIDSLRMQLAALKRYSERH